MLDMCGCLLTKLVILITTILMGPLQHEKGGRGRVVVASSTLSPIMLSPARNGTLHTPHSTQFSVTKTGTLNLSGMGSQAEYRSIRKFLVAHHDPLQLSIYDGLPPVYHLIETKLSVSSAKSIKLFPKTDYRGWV